MKRIAIFLSIMLISIMILMSGCSGSGKNNSQGEAISVKDYRTGSQGLQLKFVDNSPPDKIYSGDEMDITVEIKNLGAYPTTDSFDGKIEVYGFDEKAFSGEHWDGSNYISSDFQGKSQFNPQGGRELKRYSIDRVSIPFNAEFLSQNIVAAACYKYKTIAQPKVCIDPEPYSVFDEHKVCTLNMAGKTYSLGTQGAPVAVTKVTEEISRNNIHFGIYFKNVGGGKVVDLNVMKDCPLHLESEDLNKLIVKPKLDFDGAPSCQPRGDYSDPVVLDDSGEGFIFCTFRKPDSKSAFETLLQINVDYRYMSWIEKDLKIVNVDR